MSIRIPRLGIPRWLALVVAGIVLFTGIYYWPAPYIRGPFTRRVGFCIECKNSQWAVTCASDRSPEPSSDSEANIRGVVVWAGENLRGWRMTMFQRSRAHTIIESHSERLDDAMARATMSGVRADLAASADVVAPGAGLAIEQEPGSIDRTLWPNVIRRAVFIVLIWCLWWFLRGSDDAET